MVKRGKKKEKKRKMLLGEMGSAESLSQRYPEILLSANKSEPGGSERDQVCSAKIVAIERASMKSRRECDRARKSEISWSRRCESHVPS